MTWFLFKTALISTMTLIKSWISSLPHCWIQFQFNPANIEVVWSLDCIMRLRCPEGQQCRDLDKETQCHRHHLLLMSENLMLMWPVWEVWSKLCGHYRANTWHTELCNHLRVFTLTLHRAICSPHTHTRQGPGPGVVSWSTRPIWSSDRNIIFCLYQK